MSLMDNDEIKFEKLVSEQDDSNVDNALYKINTYGADWTLELLSQKIETGEIKVPTFQRRYVWPPKKASKLIESFLLGLPVPQIFLYRTEDQKLLVVDGQQRLKTINYFFGGKFENGSSFYLRDVKDQWEGKAYSDLSEPDKRRFKNYILRATIFEQTDPKDHSSVFEIFHRLNTGGVALNEQEIRNCIIHGKINAFLIDLNNNRIWRRLLRKGKPDSRMKDIEMILRFLSLYEGWKKYKKPMKDFITDFMRCNKDLEKHKAEKYRNLFCGVMKVIDEQIGGAAFRLHAGINVALFDAISVGIAYSMPDVSAIKNGYHQLTNNQAFLESISSSTTDVDRVHSRIKLAIHAFK